MRTRLLVVILCSLFFTSTAHAVHSHPYGKVGLSIMVAESSQRASAMGSYHSVAVERGETSTTFRYKGKFIDKQGHVPYGHRLPSGTHLSLTYSNATGHLTLLKLTGKRQRIHKKRARASWAHGCTQAEHCYQILRDWSNGWEYVNSNLEMTNVIVPGWEQGAFVDTEVWTAFNENPYHSGHHVEWWVEAGLTAGEFSDCCTAYAFTAEETEGGYIQAVNASPAVSGHTDETYCTTMCAGISFSSWLQPAGYWRVYSGGNGVEVSSMSYPFPHFSDELQVGNEIATDSPPQMIGKPWYFEGMNGREEWEEFHVNQAVVQVGCATWKEQNIDWIEGRLPC